MDSSSQMYIFASAFAWSALIAIYFDLKWSDNGIVLQEKVNNIKVHDPKEKREKQNVGGQGQGQLGLVVRIRTVHAATHPSRRLKSIQSSDATDCMTYYTSKRYKAQSRRPLLLVSAPPAEDPLDARLRRGRRRLLSLSRERDPLLLLSESESESEPEPEPELESEESLFESESESEDEEDTDLESLKMRCDVRYGSVTWVDD